MRKFIAIVILVSASFFAQSQVVEKATQKGNEYYKQRQFEKATEEYNKALLADPENTTTKFNLANSLQKQGKQDEALKSFSELSEKAKEKELKSKSYYNKGVVLTQQKKLEESIEAYKNSLRQNPDDKEARENLQKALLELKKKNPPKKKEEKENQKKKQQEQQKKQQQPKMSPKEAEQRLKLLEQKEKEVNQRLQKEKSKTGGGQVKDW
ncbi:MAG TPA: tetratricopeptide repeat protein [Chitinophagaceae bacterium]|nr:tetratricopeptide repeat protein [Chitinophagaceae bacterium]HQV85422.1 tetratricopeptide repeat protein [Chitinophagaceae bacterium]HQZ73309.1 tetratricopeptide repeat protein [Chitinophagaceae bacterium]